MRGCRREYGREIHEGMDRHYREYTESYMSKGHRLCLEYLGRKSIFTRYFRKLGSKDPEQNRSFKLPMVVKVPRDDNMMEEN